MKILVISGFLGAGKTTFIRELIRLADREIAILENEYASVGVDGRLLESSLPPVPSSNIWEMTEGCICCSMKRDFATSVLTIANTVNPQYLIIEPTGVGMLSHVIRNLQQIEYERISLLAPVTIVDGKSCKRYLAEYPEIFRDQITSAHMIVVSKMEQAEKTELDAVRTLLQGINPQAEIVTHHYSSMAKDWWDGLFQQGYHGNQLSTEQETPVNLPESFSLEDISMDTPEALILFLEELIRGQFGNLFRAKGFIRAGTQMLRFDVVNECYAITGEIDAQKACKAVFIGENIAREKIVRRFHRKKSIRAIRRKLP